MMAGNRIAPLLALAAATLTGLAGSAKAQSKPLKVYILAGQSNMEGQAAISTFDYIGDDPKTAPLLKAMRDPDGKPHTCQRVWISYLTGSPERGMLGEGCGKLTAGYGARSNPKESGGKIGPEFTFGLMMEQAYDGPILLIKTAWGGKSLHTDFRPPSGGPYEFDQKALDGFRKRGQDIDQVKAEKAAKTGFYYRLMIEHVKKVLADPKRIVPTYEPKAGYEIAGFVWFQGWNDMVDSGTYPNKNAPGGYDLYSKLMAAFIRDVRKDLGTPKMPFVIGVMGVGGIKDQPDYFRQAMAAPAKLPEFKGNVAAVETAPFWDPEMESLQSKKAAISRRLSAAYFITEEGVKEQRDTGKLGWKPLGEPAPADRTWRFMSFDPAKESEQMPKTEKKRYRIVTLPAGLEKWYEPGFDDSKWNSGKAPIGVGAWKDRSIGKASVKYNSDWGKGEFLLMRTTFNVDSLDYAAYRIVVLARQGFHVYLNGHKIHTYIWWKNDPHYRPIELSDAEAKYVKKGANVLAVYANLEYDRRTGEPFAAIDVAIEAISKEGKAYMSSQEYLQKEMDKICTRREQRIIAGSSNAGFHYLGSGKIMAQIGKAFAEAIVKMEKK